MDQLYFLDGYYEGNYFVYTADVIVGFTPYIANDYLNTGFFEDRGSSASVVCEITRVRFILFDAALASAFAQTTTARKDARTSITLSTIADVSAQALKLRQLSSSFTATATQTAQTEKTARATIALTSAFAPVITANASVSNGSNFTSSFTLTASSGITRQFPVNQLTGAATSTSPSYYPQILDFDQAQFLGPSSLDIRDVNWTFGIWVKRESRTSVFETIAATTVNVGGNNQKAAIAFRGSNIRFRFNFFSAQSGPTWTNVAPNNTDWHHYLFRSVNVYNNQPVDNWQLWVDGVYQGVNANTPGANVDIPWAGWFGSQISPQIEGGVVLGNQTLASDTPGGAFEESPLNGAFAQAWMGSVSDAQFDPNKFWNNGAIDLGATGVSTGLPTPIIYNRLTTAYTGVTWTNSGGPLAATQPLTLPSVQARFTLAGNAVSVIEDAASLQSNVSVAVIGTRVLVLAATLAAASTQSGTAVKTARVSETLTSNATLTASAEKLRGVSAGLTTTATFSATAFKVKQFASDVAAAVTFSATATRTRGITETLTTTASISTTVFKRLTAQAALAANFNVVAQINITGNGIVLNAGAFTLTIISTRLKFGTSAVTATVTTATTANAIKRAVSTLSSQFTQAAAADVVKIVIANFASQFSITSIVFRAIIGQAALSANGFVLTQGDILNFDPCREIKAEEETRLAKILPESRLLIVESETRTLRVPQETRVLRVDYETRVNIIKC